MAVIGLGSIGRRHVQNLRRLGIEHVVAMRRPSSSLTPEATVVHSHEDVLAHRPDLVIVCTPTATHVDVALEYIRRDVPVLLEKPVAATAQDARALETIGAEAWIGVAYCLRHHPAYLIANDWVRRRQLGRVLYARAWFESYLPKWHPNDDYRASYAARADLGGGVLPTLDHEIDFMNWCFGEPLEIRGAMAKTGALDADVCDVAFLRTGYSDGVTATVSLSLCRRDYSRGFVLVGEEGTLSYSFDPPELMFSDGVDVQRVWDGSSYDLNEMYVAMLRAAIEAVLNGEAPPIPLRAGIACLETVDALGPEGA